MDGVTSVVLKVGQPLTLRTMDRNQSRVETGYNALPMVSAHPVDTRDIAYTRLNT